MSTYTTLPKPTAVVAADDYTLMITFNNDEMRLFNVAPYLIYPAFDALKTLSLFKNARVAHNTVVWNEDVDMAPESLYLESTPI
jgi:hypothetical protein